MIDGHSFNFLAIESGPSNPPHAGRHNEERGGKSVKGQRGTLPLPKLVDFTLEKKNQLKKIPNFFVEK
jgi:hypothetical protein